MNIDMDEMGVTLDGWADGFAMHFTRADDGTPLIAISKEGSGRVDAYPLLPEQAAAVAKYVNAKWLGT